MKISSPRLLQPNETQAGHRTWMRFNSNQLRTGTKDTLGIFQFPVTKLVASSWNRINEPFHKLHQTIYEILRPTHTERLSARGGESIMDCLMSPPTGRLNCLRKQGTTCGLRFTGGRMWIGPHGTLGLFPIFRHKTRGIFLKIAQSIQILLLVDAM